MYIGITECMQVGGDGHIHMLTATVVALYREGMHVYIYACKCMTEAVASDDTRDTTLQCQYGHSEY